MCFLKNKITKLLIQKFFFQMQI